MKRRRFTIAWSAWIILFGVIETTALRTGHGTLSEHLVYLFRTHTKTGRWAWIIVSATGAAVLTKHILDYGIRFGALGRLD